MSLQLSTYEAVMVGDEAFNFDIDTFVSEPSVLGSVGVEEPPVSGTAASEEEEEGTRSERRKRRKG